MSEFQRLVELLIKQSTSQDHSDVWRWKPGNSGVFSVKSYYRKLLIREEVDFPRFSVCIPRVLRKVCFFIWLAARGVILMADNLRKRKITYVSWCSMCRDQVKTRTISFYIAR